MPTIHGSMLKPSGDDTIALGFAVHHRFLDLTETYARIKGTALMPPKSMNRDMLLWRSMVVRHKSGDHRNSDDEKRATRRIAEWTLLEKAKLAETEPNKITWKD